MWYKLKREKGYTRRITSTYRVMKRLNIKFYEGMKIKDTSKRKHNKHYETPKNIGEKWQIDVKYVPNECKTKELPEDKRFYQYLRLQIQHKTILTLLEIFQILSSIIITITILNKGNNNIILTKIINQ